MKSIKLFLTKFFPITLFLLVLRKSLPLILTWYVLFAMVSGQSMVKYGIPFLFLSPEYLGEVSWIAFGILGMSAGLFIMAFHVSSYVFHSLRFPFLATLRRPLYRFAINNSVIPLSFMVFFAISIYQFDAEQGKSWTTIAIHILSLLSGSMVVIGIIFSYFFSTLRKLEPLDVGEHAKGIGRLAGRMKLDEIEKLEEEVVYAYLRSPFNIRIPRQVGHYSRELMIKTIHRHHLSAVVFSLLLLSIVILLGLFGESNWLEIPAGGTIFLLFSLGLMIYTIGYTWFKAWTPAVLIVLFVVINQFGDWGQVHPAFGMNYEESALVPYSDSVITSHIDQYQMEGDRYEWIKILDQWKERTGEDKPLMIVLNVSGGGLRSSLYSYAMWKMLDEQTEGEFSKNCVLVTGASGGMVGASLYRELYGNRWKEDPEREGRLTKGQEQIAKDLLNPTAFHFMVNDLFVRLKKVRTGGKVYPFDRGFAFDQQLEENTEGVLSGSFFKTDQQESSAEIPALLLAPTIVNDGRRLLISSQPSSFLCSPVRNRSPLSTEIDGLELRRFFEQADADSLRLSTALRMSASFPYVTPLVEMPSDPAIELIDAGVRDNDGFALSLRFLEAMEPWIKAECRGVLVIRLRGDRQEQIEISEQERSWTSRWVRPVSGVVTSFANLQTYNKVDAKEHMKRTGLDIRYRDYFLIKQQERFALSWHLTEQEKMRIENAVVNLQSDSSEVWYWRGQFP